MSSKWRCVAGRCAVFRLISAATKKSKGKFFQRAGGLTACQKVVNLVQLTSAANLNRLRMSS